ncbi:MAG TPA: Lrp/AsnC family transcriptional regulator [Firmicutes bacterium]|nr:MAG: AsnC family transcriptional regulator [Peptococcaceae bacterium 1109]HHT73633.1 Lrp/AsnC family transcriptional regulator [Bacillota bacterium]
MRQEILQILEGDSRLSAAQIAVMLDSTEEAVQAEISRLEEEGVIVCYHTLIDWEKAGRELVTAHIAVKVTPQRGSGFDQTALRIAEFPEVQAVFLVSGDFDLMVLVEGATIQDIARFVSTKLAVMDSVVSCTTHFVLKKFKQNGRLFGRNHSDERPNILL